MDLQFLRKVKRHDRFARWVITIGGMFVIFSVIAILFLIVKVTLPLFQQTGAELQAEFDLSETGPAEVMAVGVDEYLVNGFQITREGRLIFVSLKNKEIVREDFLTPDPGKSIRAARQETPGIYTILWDDSSRSILKVSTSAAYDADNKRLIQPEFEILFEIPAADRKAPCLASISKIDSDGGLTLVDLYEDNALGVVKQVMTENLFGDVSIEEFSNFIEPSDEQITALALSRDGGRLFAGTGKGAIWRWDISDAEAIEFKGVTPAFRDNVAITAMNMVFGSISLAVGDSRGGMTTWMEVENEAGVREFRMIHVLKPHASAVRFIKASIRDKSLLSMSEKGVIHLDHMTSERHLLALAPEEKLEEAALAGRGNGIIASNGTGRIRFWRVRNPHPEVSFRTLFGKVWYESYDQPDYVWQSSSGSDDFEPKLSIVPLIFGTVKGTVYAMIFAIPLAIFGAAYISQFTTPRFRSTIKPAIEIMASVPSVVIGFLIALWLAPIVERNIVGVFASLILVPLFFVLFMLFWQFLLGRFNAVRHMRTGYEFLILAPVMFLALATAFYVGPFFERLLFSGDFSMWLFNEFGSTYDQRNSIIIAFGLGFTVIPIIFSIAEDSISSVPANLTAASMALGASRWQTVWRVMLPSASPGIFAAVMIGFGRAVGETMIVLMATGNTPIMDWSIFNGMRTLSANIAVEIPEAPVDGTLYRVLFLCAVILFVLTFILNTGAEIVREHLRKKYMRY